MLPSVMLWRRLDVAGHEFCALASVGLARQLTGVALVAHDGFPCRLDYEIVCDQRWETQRGRVWGRIGRAEVAITVERTPDHAWIVNGLPAPALAGCIDVDLGFSPSTNLLPIKRLALAVGQRAEVRAVWVQFPTLHVDVLTQSYERLSESAYRYESADGAFARELQVDDTGFVREYPGLWTADLGKSPSPSPNER